MNVWKAWSEHKGIKESIETLSTGDINSYLSSCIMEVNRQDGSLYSAELIYQIVSRVQQHLKKNGRPELGTYSRP